MVRNTLEHVYEIEQTCFVLPWSRISIEHTLNRSDSICIVEDYCYILGFKLLDECELYRIAVMPEHRSKGLAYSLIQRFLEIADCRTFLEVASKNTAAVKLYEKCGFKQIAFRKNYYPHLNDDAIVMQWDKSKTREPVSAAPLLSRVLDDEEGVGAPLTNSACISGGFDSHRYDKSK